MITMTADGPFRIRWRSMGTALGGQVFLQMPRMLFAATVVRKEFEAKKEIAGAHAYVSGLGFFEMKINGRLPDDTLMNVANTQYTQTASYRAFDDRPGKAGEKMPSA